VHSRVVRADIHVLVEVAVADRVGVLVAVATRFAHTDSAVPEAALVEHLEEDSHFLVVWADSRTLVAPKGLPAADWGRGRSVGCLQVNHTVRSPIPGVHSLVGDLQLVPCLEAVRKDQKVVLVFEFAGAVLREEP
jgi:hypothetical protein